MRDVVFESLARGAVLSISVSGGKDSQAMTRHLVSLRAEHGWTGPAELIHADLGRAEWPQTPAHVERCASEVALPLVVVRRAKGDLLARIQDRLKSVSTTEPGRPAKPFWPSSAQRYCTSDLKRGPIQVHQRTHGSSVIISAQGLRAAESSGRAKKAAVSIDQKLTAKHLRELTPAEALVMQGRRGGRLVITWLPIHAWSTSRVWSELGTHVADLNRRRLLYRMGKADAALEGWTAHPAYVFGNERLSCALCVLGSKSDLENGARHNPELLEQYVALERTSTYTFRQDLSLADLQRSIRGAA